MVASMIVVLPNPFEGGRLVVRHGAVQQDLRFDEARSLKAPSYAAFYADCEHEVERVSSGVRLCLAYNLVLKARGAQPAAAEPPAGPADEVAPSIGTWVAARPGEPLVFALEHHYTQAGLSLELLKGEDRQLADLVVAASEKAGCLVHLAQVTRHLLQEANDGDYEDDYRYAPRRRRSSRAIEIGETFEDELSGADWTDIQGRKLALGEIPFELPAIVSQTPINDWKPTEEEYEGYTGNAGNTLDRWYHRSALVVWRRDDHYEVLADAGPAASFAAFGAMAAKLAKTPKKRLEAERADCLRFARAIIARWPRRDSDREDYATEVSSHYNEFPKQLLLLRDRDMIAAFLAQLPTRDDTTRIAAFVAEACHAFGWAAFASELKLLIAAPPVARGSQELPRRDLEWLSAYCCDPAEDAERSALANEWCALVVERYCAPRPPRAWRRLSEDDPRLSVAETSLPLLLKALLAVGRDEDLSRVFRFVRETPDEFRMGRCVVPFVISLVAWSQERFGTVPQGLASWLASVRQQLEKAAAQEPAQPTNWARQASIPCACKFCGQLNVFLADPAQKEVGIPASEDNRRHLTGMANKHQCDVQHTLVRQGSPFTLAFTKTTAAHERAVKRFKEDCKLLSELPPAP